MSTSVMSTMTPERWQTVDHILQGALTCPHAQRDAFVATACGDDTLLRTEVSSLLVAYDATPADFLERPAIEEHGLNSETASQPPSTNTTALPQASRMVTARLAVYASAAGIVLGVSRTHRPSRDGAARSRRYASRRAGPALSARLSQQAPRESAHGHSSSSIVVVESRVTSPRIDRARRAFLQMANASHTVHLVRDVARATSGSLMSMQVQHDASPMMTATAAIRSGVLTGPSSPML